MAVYEFENPQTKQVYEVDVPEGVSPDAAFNSLMEEIGELPSLGDSVAPQEQGLQEGESLEDYMRRSYKPNAGQQVMDDLVRKVGGASRTALTGILDVIPGFEGEQVNILPPSLAESMGIGDLNRLESVEGVMGGARGLAEDIGLVEGTDVERTPVREGLRLAGQTLGPAGLIMSLLRKAGPVLNFAKRAPLPGFKEGAKRVGADVLEHATNKPVLAASEEMLGGFGAGFAGELANEGGAGPLGETVAELAGGIAAGTTPVGVQNLLRRGTRALTEMVPAPEFRAARRLQEMSADPQADAAAAAATPAGLTPATATGSPGLQRLENRVLADDVRLESRVETGLQQTERAAIDELSTHMGPGTKPEDWRHSVVERVAAPGTTVAKGQTDQMMREAYEGYETAYDAAKGFPIYPRVMAEGGAEPSLQQGLLAAVMRRDGLTGGKARKQATEFLNDQLQGMDERVARGARPGPRGTVTSDDLIDMRHNLRTEQRRQQRAAAGGKNQRAEDLARLYNRAQSVITRVLESQLPPKVSTQLKAIDARYRDFKTVEDAALRAGDLSELEPRHLQTSLRQRESRGRLTRGEAGDLQMMTRQGVADVAPDKALKDVELTKRAVRDMTPEQAQAFRSNLNNEVTKNAEITRQDGTSAISGKKLTEQLHDSRDALKAAGYTDEDLGRMDRVANTLLMIQNRSQKEAAQLIEDAPGIFLRVLAQIAGAKAGVGLARRLSTGAVGAGVGLQAAQIGSKIFRERLRAFTRDDADALLRAVMQPSGTVIANQADGTPITSEQMFAKLLTQPTAPVKKQVEAAKIINAFLIPAVADEREDRSE